MTIRSQYYSGSCLVIVIAEDGSVDVRYPGVDLIPPELSSPEEAIVYVYVDFKEELVNNIMHCRDASVSTIDATTNLQKVMWVIKSLTDGLRSEDRIPNSTRACVVSRSQLKILTRTDYITPRLYMDILGSEVMYNVGSSEADIVSFIISTAAPQSCLVLVEGNSSKAKEVLGSNLTRWRDVALSYSTGNTVSAQNPISLPNLVCLCDTLEDYISFSEFCSYQRLANSSFDYVNGLSDNPVSYRDYAAMHSLLCLRYANGYLYSSVDAYSVGPTWDILIYSNENTSIDPDSIPNMEWRRYGDCENIVSTLGCLRTTNPYSVFELMSGPNDFDKGMFKTVCKLTTTNKTFPKQVVETKVDYHSYSGLLKARVARAISIVLRAHVLKKFLDSSDITEKLKVDKGCLSYGQLINKGPVRKKVLQGLHTSIRRIKEHKELVRTKTVIKSTADLNRLEAVSNYFESLDQSKLLNCWSFNNTDSMSLLFPEYCLTEKKLYGNSSVFDNSKSAVAYMVSNKLESLGANSCRIITDDSSSYATIKNTYSPELIVPFVLCELYAKGSINNFEYSEKLFGSKEIMSLRSVKDIMHLIDVWDSLVDSLIPEEVRTVMSRQKPLKDSYLLFPELWTKEFLSSISLEFITNDKESCMYDLLRHQISTKLTHMLNIYSRLGYLSISVLNHRVSGKSKEPSTSATLEIVNNYAAGDTDPRGNSYRVDGVIAFTDDMPTRAAGISIYAISSTGQYLLDYRILRVLLSMPVEDFLDEIQRAKLVECIEYALPSIVRIRTAKAVPMLYIEQLELLISKLKK